MCLIASVKEVLVHIESMCATRDKRTTQIKRGRRRTSESDPLGPPSALHLHPSQTTVTESLYNQPRGPRAPDSGGEPPAALAVFLV